MLLSRGGFEGTRPRAQKKSEAKIKNRSLENRPQRGQKHECLGKDTTRKCSPKKNTSLLKKLQIFRETQAFSKKRKNLRSKKSQIFSKKTLSKFFREFSGRTFSRTCRLRGQIQGLQTGPPRLHLCY